VRQEVHRKSPKFTFKLKCPIGKTLDHRSRGDTTWRAQTGKVESSHMLVTRQEMPVQFSSVSSRSPHAHSTTVSTDGSAPLGQHKY
jgi:hypothetical protein